MCHSLWQVSAGHGLSLPEHWRGYVQNKKKVPSTFQHQVFGTFWNTDLRTFTLTYPQKVFASPRQWLCIEVQHNFVVRRRRCLQTTNDESLAGVAAVSPTAKGAHNGSLAPEERTVQKKKQALSLALHIDDCSVQIFLSCNKHGGTDFYKANDGSEDEEGAQDAVDRAFATFVAAHKIELSTFRSAEWANVLVAADKSPLQ